MNYLGPQLTPFMSKGTRLPLNTFKENTHRAYHKGLNKHDAMFVCLSFPLPLHLLSMTVSPSSVCLVVGRRLSPAGAFSSSITVSFALHPLLGHIKCL